MPAGKLKRKTVYFLKLVPGPLPKEDFDKSLVHGDLSEAALEQLSLLAQEVFLPLLCSPHNQAGWPEMVTREVMDNMYKFSASATVTVGLSKGQTLLPVPPVGVKKARSNATGSSKASYDGDGRSVRPSDNSSMRPSAAGSALPTPGGKFSSVTNLAHAAALLGPHASMVAAAAAAEQQAISQHDMDMIHVVESSVVLWTQQIKNVLRTEPDQARAAAFAPSALRCVAQHASNMPSCLPNRR